MPNLVSIKLHGALGQHVGKTWKLAVSSVGEAMRAIEMNSKHKLYKFFADNDPKGLRYRVLINGRDFISEKPVTIQEPETVANSELACKIKNLKTIDIVPVLEGGGDLADGINAILGIILIIVGVILAFGGAPEFGVPLILIGLGLAAAGVIGLLSKPPKFDDFREIDGATGRTSYLFNGPENVTKEGGPVPVGYGRVLVGSQVISASYVVKNVSADAIVSTLDTSPGAIDSSFYSKFDKTNKYILGQTIYSPDIIPEPMPAPKIHIEGSSVYVFGKTVQYGTAVAGVIPKSYYAYIYEINFLSGQNTYHLLVPWEQIGDPSQHFLPLSLATSSGKIQASFSSPPDGLTTERNGKFYVTRTRVGGGFNQPGTTTTTASVLVENNGIKLHSQLIRIINNETNNLNRLIVVNSPTASYSEQELLLLPRQSSIKKIRTDIDGNIIYVGDFTTSPFDSVSKTYKFLIKTSPEGILHSNFVVPTLSAATTTLYDVCFDGQNMYVAGDFTTIGGHASPKLARLIVGSDGTLTVDTTFTAPLFNTGSIIKVIKFYNGSLYVGGDFTSVGGSAIYKLCKITSGTLDTSFVPEFSVVGYVSDIAFQLLNNKILAGGNFTYGNINQKFLVRLNSTGTLDTTMDDIGADGEITEVAVLEGYNFGEFQGRILVAGLFKKIGPVEFSFNDSQKTPGPNRIALLYNGDYIYE